MNGNYIIEGPNGNPRAICPGCGRLLAVTSDGVVRKPHMKDRKVSTEMCTVRFGTRIALPRPA